MKEIGAGDGNFSLILTQNIQFGGNSLASQAS
jgi:hypothetical protein